VRDRRTLASVVVMPVLQLILYGYLTYDVTHLRTVVVDYSCSPESRRFLDALRNTTYFDLVAYTDSDEIATGYLDSGRCRAAVVIPPRYASDVELGRAAQVQVVVDASDPTVARSALNAASLLGEELSVQLQLKALRRVGASGIRIPRVDIRARAWYNPDLRNVNFLVPGLLGVVLQMLTTFLTSMAIARERERGTLEQLVVTPVRSTELMVGKLAPYCLVGYAVITLSLLCAVVLFRVPMRGSLGLLYVLTLGFFFSSLGYGILVSTLSHSQMQAAQLAWLSMLPGILLSGFIFPRESLPPLLRAIGSLLPLTYFIAILRGIILKGSGLVYLWPQIVPMVGIGAALLAVSVARFHKRIG